MHPENHLWEMHEGRDREGEKFRVCILIHGSGRIPAKVVCPVVQDEFYFRVVFILEPEMDKEDYHFVSLESAQQFITATLEKRSAAVQNDKPSKFQAARSAFRSSFRRLFRNSN